MKDLFKGIKNVEFTGTMYSKGVGAELPVFTLNEPTMEEWNEKARIQNTKSFIKIHNRQPDNYEEVLEYLWSLFPERNEKLPEIPRVEYVPIGLNECEGAI